MQATTTPVTPQQHTARMCKALENVRFGPYNGGASFHKQMARNVAAQVALTPRQQWWLTTLVVRHRKQVKDQSAVAIAEAWLRANAEPTSPEKEAGPGATAPTPAPAPDPQPQLF